MLGLTHFKPARGLPLHKRCLKTAQHVLNPHILPNLCTTYLQVAATKEIDSKKPSSLSVARRVASRPLASSEFLPRVRAWRRSYIQATRNPPSDFLHTAPNS